MSGTPDGVADAAGVYDAETRALVEEVGVGRWPGYPQYRHARDAWFGTVPMHWNVARLKFVVALSAERVEAAGSELPYMGLENIESWTGKYVATESSADGISNLFRRGDVLFGKLRPYLAKVLLAETSGICSSEALVLRSKALVGNYLKYLLLGADLLGRTKSTR